MRNRQHTTPFLIRIRSSLRPRRRKGQAIVEFALVVPIMVTILLFAMYFYELNQVKLKVQEAARYAAWEMTAYPLHDYSKTSQGQYYTKARNSVLLDAMPRYLNLRSTDKLPGNSYVTIGWTPPIITMHDQMEPKIPSGRDLVGFDLNMVFNFVGFLADVWSAMSFKHKNPVLVAMMAGYWSEQVKFFGGRFNRFNPPSRWGFNTKGYPAVTVRLRFRNKFIPNKFMDGAGQLFSKRHVMAKRFTLRERTALVADSWRLHYGDNVDNNAGKDTAYWKAVDRMAFVSPAIRNGVRTLLVIPIQTLTWLTAIATFGYAPPPTADPMATTVVSHAYKNGNPASGQITLNEDKGSHAYDTAPDKEGSEYRKTFKDRGNNFMGCSEPERLTCGSTLSSDNPFGDYVVPPPN
ncbi:MAG: pilus assembly protein [Deltaproteobacteria bacterium]|nr:pilus assembly protein [Deltaproteobacteria bacterium]